jgi:hypothetical protein
MALIKILSDTETLEKFNGKQRETYPDELVFFMRSRLKWLKWHILNSYFIVHFDNRPGTKFSGEQRNPHRSGGPGGIH